MFNYFNSAIHYTQSKDLLTHRNWDCYRASGSVSFTSAVPDTITSWVATAFAVHPETGLGLSEAAAKVGVYIHVHVMKIF